MPEPRKRKRARNQVPKPGLDSAAGDNSGVPPTGPEDAEVMGGPIPEEPVNTDSSLGQDAPERVVEEHNGRGVAQLLNEPEFLNRMISEMETTRTLESVTEEIADKVSDALEDSPKFRRRLIDTFMSSEVARAKFIRATAKALTEPE